WSDSSSIYVISSSLDIADAAQGRGRLHEMQNQRQAAASIATRSVTALAPRDIHDAVAAAFAGFKCERPRPAYLELPLDLLNQPAGSGWQARSLPARPRAGADQLDEAAGLLGGARQPVLIVGGGAVDAAAPARAVAEALGAIVLTTIAGKGIVPAGHPLCLGSRMPQPAVQQLLREADVILVAGSEISETDLWDATIEFSGKIIRIDLDPASLARPHGAAVAILADAALTLAAIAGKLAGRDPAKRRAASEARIAGLVRNEAAGENELRRDMRKLLTVIREALPADAIVASDMTQIAYAANEIFPMDTPRAWIHPVGFGTLGFALPAAIGAKVGLPNRPVAALAGDYGFQYTVNELGTAVEMKQSLPILLWNNGVLGAIRDDMIGKGIQPNAVTLRNPDFQALAHAYGAHAEKPGSLSQLGAAIARSLNAGVPTLIEMTPQLLH
ncbi:MAG: thiamine pyrophosphate-dependent enzyme, partial [Pseudomonadota bacterium]|nr:thiamine pyrophosphate-dependent enzyme [Pseudomonadota bacterium]